MSNKSGIQNGKISRAYTSFTSKFIWRGKRLQVLQWLFEILSNFQLLSIILSEQLFWFNIDTEGSTNRFFKFICQLLSFKGYFTSETDNEIYNAAAAAIFVYFAVVILIVSWLAYQSYKQKKIHYLVRDFSLYLAELHHTVIFWIINAILLALVNNRSKIEKGETSVFVVTGIFMPINYVVGLWTASHCSDPFISRNLLAKSDTTYQLTTFWYKAILGFISGFIGENDYKWAFACVSLGLTWVRYELLLRNVYYFNFLAFKLAALVASMGVSFSLGNIIVAIVNHYHEVSWSYLFFSECVIAALIMILTNSRIDKIITNYISQPRDKILKGSFEVLRKLMALSYIYTSAGLWQGLLDENKSFNSSLLYLIGYTGKHQGNCEYSGCFCKEKRTGLFGNQEVGSVGLIYAQCEVLQAAISNLKDNVEYKIMLISLQQQRQELFARAFATLYSLHGSKITFKQEVYISEICEKLEGEIGKFFVKSKDEYLERDNNIMDIKKMVDFNQDSETLLKLLEQSCERYIKIWDYYCQNEMVLAEFLKQISHHEGVAQEIESRWNSLACNFSDYALQLYPVYYAYLSLIKNIPVLAEKRVLAPYYRGLKIKESDFTNPANNRIVHQIENNTKNNVVFYISVARETLGKVKYVSHNVQKLLGWPQAEAIGENISIFQPPFIGRHWSQVLQYYIEKEAYIIKNCRKGFARTRDGFLCPTYTYVTLYPYLGMQPMYIVIHSPRALSSEALIISEDGMIDCFTRGIAEKLGLNPNKAINISQVCNQSEKLEGLLEQFEDKKPQDLGKLNTFQTENNMFVKDKKMDLDYETKFTLKQGEELYLTLSSASDCKKEITFSVKVKRTDVPCKMLCLYLTEKETKRKAKSPRKVSKLLEDEEFSDDIPIETFDKIGLSVENRLTVDGDYELLSPGQSSTSPLRTHLGRPDNLKLIPKGVLTGSSRLLLTSARQCSNGYLPNTNVFQSSEDSHRDLIVIDKTRRESLERYAAPSSERMSIAGPNKTDMGERLEKAVYHLPKDKLMNLLNYLITAFVITCCVLVIIYVVYEKVKLNSIQKTNDVIASSQRQTTTLLNAITPFQFVALVNLGIISDLRFASAGVTSLRYYMRSKVDYYLVNYVEVTREVNNNLSYVSSDLLAKLYEDRFLVNYYLEEDDDTTTKRKVNNFELAPELTNALTNIVETPVEDFYLNNTDILFVLNNSMNDPLVASENEVDIILADAKENLNYVLSINLMLALLAAAIGIILLVLLSVDFKKYLRKRDYLIEILLRLDQNRITSHLVLARSFHDRLKAKEYEFENEKELKAASLGFVNNKDFAAGEEKRGHAKHQNEISNRNLNFQTIVGLIMTMISIVIFVSIFIIFNILFRTHLDKVLLKLDNMVEINQMGIDLSLANVALLDYIMNNNSTKVKNKPIEQVLEKIFEDAESIPKFFLTISSEGEYQNDVVNTILEGSLCDVPDLVPYTPAVCSALANGILDKGLIRVLTLFIQSIENTKTTFDYYNHTTAGAIRALNNKEKITAESIATLIVISYLRIESILNVQLNRLIDNHEHRVVEIVIVYAFIYVFLGTCLYTKIWRNVKYERLNWRKTLRLVPFPIIHTNKLLKLYLVNHSDNMLDSIKSALL